MKLQWIVLLFNLYLYRIYYICLQYILYSTSNLISIKSTEIPARAQNARHVALYICSKFVWPNFATSVQILNNRPRLTWPC